MNEVLDDLMMKINLFLFKNIRNEWIYFDYGKIYVRKSKRNCNGEFIDCFDFSSIELDEEYRGKGFFKLFLNKFINTYPNKNIFVESILNPELYVFLKKFGFKENGSDESNNLILVK